MEGETLEFLGPVGTVVESIPSKRKHLKPGPVGDYVSPCCDHLEPSPVVYSLRCFCNDYLDPISQVLVSLSPSCPPQDGRYGLQPLVELVTSPQALLQTG